MDNTIHYRNTDLDIVAQEDLTELASLFETNGLVALHVTAGDDGLWYATFETEEQFDEPEGSIATILTVIESLDEPLRALWTGCGHRVLDIGYDCGTEPWGFHQSLSPGLLKRIAASSASLRITLYPHRDLTPSLPNPITAKEPLEKTLNGDQTSASRSDESPNSSRRMPHLSSIDKYREHILRFGFSR